MTNILCLVNPYVNRGGISKLEHFFGRTTEVHRIFDMLSNYKNPGAIAITGERRIGKTSLLKYISNRAIYGEQLPGESNYLFVFLDLSGVPPALDAFFSRIFQSVRGQVPEIAKAQLSSDLAGLEALLVSLSTKGFSLILMLDEFDNAYKKFKEVFDIAFYDTLRSYIQTYPLGIITASRSSIRNLLSYSDEAFGSGFFNIFRPVKLGLFRAKEARELIEVPSAKCGYPLAPHAEATVAFAGHHPFFLQVTCDYFVRLLEEEEEEEIAISDVSFEVLRDEVAVGVLEGYLAALSDEQFNILEQVADERAPSNPSVAADLKDKGFIVKDKKRACGFRFFGSIFQDAFIKHLEKDKRSAPPGDLPLPSNAHGELYEFENWLRGVLARRLAREFGASWEDRFLSMFLKQFKGWDGERMVSTRDRDRLNHVDRSRDPTAITLLNYTELGQLKTFVARHWGLFGAEFAIQRSKKFVEEMEHVIAVRNRFAHNNPVDKNDLVNLKAAVLRIKNWYEEAQ